MGCHLSVYPSSLSVYPSTRLPVFSIRLPVFTRLVRLPIRLPVLSIRLPVYPSCTPAVSERMTCIVRRRQDGKEPLTGARSRLLLTSNQSTQYSRPARAKNGGAKKKTVGDKKCIRSAGPAPRHIRGEVGFGRA